jgi:hypothetical protein
VRDKAFLSNSSASTSRSGYTAMSGPSMIVREEYRQVLETHRNRENLHCIMEPVKIVMKLGGYLILQMLLQYHCVVWAE